MKTLRTSGMIIGGSGQAPGRIVLRDSGEGSCQRYVVHFYNEQDRGYHNGSYHSELPAALDAYQARCERFSVPPRHIGSAPQEA